jgi:ferrochelatase
VSERCDALLVLSFGGPEGLDEVRPFLENAVRGRGVPPERLDAVEEHYRHFGGVSPLNARTRELIAAIGERTSLPVYFGNRNWHPMVEDTVREMVRDAAGPPKEGGHRYSEQIAEAARLVAAELGVTEYDVVWQSRSGPPQVPWLEPDILAHIEALHAAGVPAVISAPIGFVSDHVEVIWDLDNEAPDRAAELGMGFARATTAGADPRFADMMVELIAEHVDGVPQRGIGSVSRAGCTVNGSRAR